ncbi:Mitochondrial pyruvate carrier 4 [Diplonema papillatum]|nr:Mitochondrial pyruvate carrier 4 [Diplonema papillatum]|eukprot:gene13670-21036_t
MSAWSRLLGAVFHAEYGWKTTHFWGPVANWALVASAVYDGAMKGPEVVSESMTLCMCMYSGLFMRFAWRVGPRNYLLFTCHAFNEVAQLTQFYRLKKYQKEVGEPGLLTTQDYTKGGVAAVAAAGCVAVSPRIRHAFSQMQASYFRDMVIHPAGPLTIFFWAPTTKWLLSTSNIMDWNRPVDKISTSQQLALAATGLIWSRYSMVINPVNYNLLVVNFVLATTALWHISRKIIAAQDAETIISA